ncbi:ferredoxin [Haloechinothrix sp. LS1_15]|uniref:ferredoxin n=1 Tax=Haloechinothrix sp. LS1_15 TaxID=2652248 RepID=UPI0029477D5A|nr:ferredoxin [Haloechinothrix sp. LS1_15]MDV6014114.1 ferredoxin [Haloechinothrix sp. LS1_15]
MRVVVDHQACEANGVCEGIAPEIFQLDEDDNLHLLDQPGADSEERVRRAVRSCPKVALSLEGDRE